jgi:REP element-mobilizing transposase RayT
VFSSQERIGTRGAVLSDMTLPRRVVPGMIQMVTRRALRRTHLLRPDPKFNQLCLYLLAVYSERYNIEVHAVVFMSNHEHLVVTDKDGRIPDFLRDYHRALALGTKVLRGWEGTLWDSDPSSRVQLCTAQAVIEKLAYLMANPVQAALVHRAEDWPGINTLPHDLGSKTWTVARPDFYFDADNPQWPTTATLRLTMPRTPWAQQEVQRRVAQELMRLESEAHCRIRAKGLRVLGRSGVLRGSPYERSTSWEPLRGTNPSIAAGRGQRQAFFQAANLLRTFRAAYRLALEWWRRGYRDVVFPTATWQMRWLHGVQVAPG